MAVKHLHRPALLTIKDMVYLMLISCMHNSHRHLCQVVQVLCSLSSSHPLLPPVSSHLITSVHTSGILLEQLDQIRQFPTLHTHKQRLLSKQKIQPKKIKTQHPHITHGPLIPPRLSSLRKRESLGTRLTFATRTVQPSTRSWFALRMRFVLNVLQISCHTCHLGNISDTLL